MKIKCKYCGQGNVVKNGMRKNKNGIVVRYKCNDCSKTFSLGEFKNKSYNAKVILAALNYYDIGYTFSESSKKVNSKFKIKTSGQLVHQWFKEHKELCSFSRFRNKNKLLDKVVVSKMFDHKQPYLFRYHKFKINELINNYFSGLRKYIENVGVSCPNHLFVSDNLRSSQFRVDSSSIKRIKIIKSKNKSCLLAELGLKAAKSNKERHALVQDFMLVNDTSTIAVEVPIWLSSSEIKEDPILKGVLGVDSDITGHIDIVQSKFGFIHVVDYKPNASYENLLKVVSQLFVYAVALSTRTGVWLRNFRCGWFDNDSYFEFNPNYIVIDYLKKNGVKSHSVWKKYWSDYIKHEKAVNLKFNKKIEVKV